jgi:hypothetical protein
MSIKMYTSKEYPVNEAMGISKTSLLKYLDKANLVNYISCKSSDG